jgi:hypothetical protein
VWSRLGRNHDEPLCLVASSGESKSTGTAYEAKGSSVIHPTKNKNLIMMSEKQHPDKPKEYLGKREHTVI